MNNVNTHGEYSQSLQSFCTPPTKTVFSDNTPEQRGRLSSLMTLLQQFSFGEKECGTYPTDHLDFIFHTMSRFFLHFLSFAFLLSSLAFLCHSHLSFWIPQVSLLLALAIMIMQLKNNNVSTFRIFLANGSCMAILLLSLLGMSRFYDFSWDGQWYHQANIFLMKNGWNPFCEGVFDYIKNNGILESLGSQWSDLYVKYVETAAANLYLMTGDIQSGKALIVLFAIACLLESFVLLHKWEIKRFPAFLFALALCLNPIALAQYTTFYVDGVLYYALLLLVLYLLRLENGEDSNICLYFDIVLAALILSNIKFTGLVYAGLMLGGYWIIALVRKQKNKAIRLLITGCCLLFLCVLTGISPYYTNIKNGRHLFHPIMGEQKIDIMTMNTPVAFRPLSPPMRTLCGLLSHTSYSKEDELKSIVKIPFSVSDQDVDIVTPDIRLGGFGWFGSGIILLGFVLGCIGLFFPSKQKKAIVFIGGLSMITVIVNPEAWWARYVPQLWIPPLLGAVLFLGGANDRFKKTKYALSAVLIFFVYLNAGFIIKQITNECLTYTKRIDSVISLMKKSKTHHKVVIRNGLSACCYTLWDNGIVCDPCSVNDIPELKNKGYISFEGREIHFLHPENYSDNTR